MEYLKRLFVGGGNAKMNVGGEAMPISSLSQGEDFAKMTRAYHGGRRTRRRMRGGAAELSAAFEPIPEDIHKMAGVASLDAAIAELPAVEKAMVAAPMTGGRRMSRRLRRGGAAPVDAPSMLLRPEDEPAAFLNPQWYQENVVNPNFQAPPSPYIAAGPSGGAKKAKKTRKAKKSRKAKKGSRKHRKSMKGGKKAKKSRKGRKTSKKHGRKH
jgi:hypothetical protein